MTTSRRGDDDGLGAERRGILRRQTRWSERVRRRKPRESIGRVGWNFWKQECGRWVWECWMDCIRTFSIGTQASSEIRSPASPKPFSIAEKTTAAWMMANIDAAARTQSSVLKLPAETRT